MKTLLKISILHVFVFFQGIELLAQSIGDFNTDVLSYHLAIQLSDSSDMIQVNEQIRAVVKVNSQNLSFDLYSIDKSGKGMRVHSLEVNGGSVDFTHENNQITINRMNHQEGDTLEFHLVFSGIPADGLIIGENKFGNRTFFGDNWPNRAHHWFACNDHPSDKALVSFDVIAPRKYQVIANGTLHEKQSISPDADLWSYKTDYELPTKVMVIGVAEFSVFDFPLNHQNAVPVSAWVYPESEKEGVYDMEQSLAILNWFEDKIGDYPFDKLANVQSTTRYGGMENASCIFYDEDAITGSRSMESLIAHEIGHQWFGNSATESDWQHLWLSEGFATYLTNLYLLETKGEQVFHDLLDKDARRIFSFHKNFQLPIIDTLSEDINFLLNANAYQKGSWVLHMLRSEISDSLFWIAIRTYYENYQFSNASSLDFQHIVEDVCNCPMSYFFDQWLKQPGHPIISMSIQKNKKSSLIVLEQLQNETFIGELTIQIYKENGDYELIKVPITKGVNGQTQEKRIVLKLPYAVDNVILDPYRELLFEQR
jgi:aminopeptidase N